MAEEVRPFGAYVLLKALGRGAMGDVHLARPYNPNRGIPTPVVIKRLHGELALKRGFVSRFRHEASVAVSVDSPHVAKVYDVGAVGDTLYIVMEHVAGWPLSKVLDAILKSGRHASIASVLDSIAGGLEGLHALHTAVDPSTGAPLGIVHRDISPKNLMIGEDGLMHIIDLGLGKSNAQDWKTRTGVVMGSVGYMPPEQVNGEHVDARADVYAMGVVSFEMLALRNFIKRGPLPAMMSASVSPRFVPPSEYRPDVPRGLDEVIEKAVNPDRAGRFQSAAEFLRALRTIVPAKQTEGGMRELVEELFGEGKLERAREIDALLALPLPAEDPMELEPTKVFVQRAGVRPEAETREGPAFEDPPSVPPTVATEVAWKEPSGSFGARGPRDPTATMRSPASDTISDRLVFPLEGRGDGVPDAFMPETAARFVAPGARGLATREAPLAGPARADGGAGHAAPLVQQPVRSGVSLSVLVVSVAIAAVAGAVAAVTLSRSTSLFGPAAGASVPVGEDPRGPAAVPAARAPLATERGVEAERGVAEAPAGAPEREPQPLAPPAGAKRLRPRGAGAGARPEPARELDPEPAPPPDQGRRVVEGDLTRALARVELLLARLPPGPNKDRVIQLKLDLRRDQGLADLEKLKQNVERAKAELHALESSE